MSLVNLIFYYSMHCCRNHATSQEAKIGSGSPSHWEPSNKYTKTRVDIDYQQLAAEIIRQQHANAAMHMHMHDSTATEIA